MLIQDKTAPSNNKLSEVSCFVTRKAGSNLVTISAKVTQVGFIPQNLDKGGFSEDALRRVEQLFSISPNEKNQGLQFIEQNPRLLN